jgi:Protein of unknown function (DUF3833)
MMNGCSGMRPEEFAQTAPEFLLEDYFQGRTLAWGLFQDRAGKPKRYFTVDIDGVQEADEFVLHESFAFRDGERSERTWRIRKRDEHTYEGRADDVAGTATGRRFGNALNWQYDLLIEAGGRQWKVHFDDWMFLHDKGVVVNRARMSKFGFPLGEVVLFFRKE